jgi:hypothetical protein
MRHLCDETAHGRGIRPLYNLIKLRQAYTVDNLLVCLRRRNVTAVVLNSNCSAGLLFILLSHLSPLERLTIKRRMAWEQAGIPERSAFTVDALRPL